MVSEFWLEALLLSYVLFYDFMTLRSVLPVTFFPKELRFPNPVHRAQKTCQKPGVITRKSQLFRKKRCRHLNTGHLIKWQKMTHFHWKKWLYDNFWWVFRHVWTGFLMLVNFINISPIHLLCPNKLGRFKSRFSENLEIRNIISCLFNTKVLFGYDKHIKIYLLTCFG